MALAVGRYLQLPGAMRVQQAPDVPKMLWSFDKATVGQWVVTSDKSVGGQSEASFRHVSELEAAGAAAGAGAGAAVDEEEPHAVFSGTLSLARSGRLKRSGYAAIISEREPGGPIDLEGYKALEMKVRTDGRTYMVNLSMDTLMDDDLYQGFVMVEPGEWHTLELPFDRFLLTARGRPRDVQRKLDVEGMWGMGVTLADKKDGDFKFEVQYIRALPKMSRGLRKAELRSGPKALELEEPPMPSKDGV
eukprot:g363.t1